MDTQNTSKFFVGSIITILITYGVIMLLLSVMQGVAKGVVSPESMADEDIAERIEPVAQVNVGAPPVAEVVVAAVATETDASGDAGAKIVKQVCALCHKTGMMSSPKLGDAEGWAPRIEQGIDTLYANAIDGFNMMPARGGNPSLSDDDVKAAVDHMIALTK